MFSWHTYEFGLEAAGREQSNKHVALSSKPSLYSGPKFIAVLFTALQQVTGSYNGPSFSSIVRLGIAGSHKLIIADRRFESSVLLEKSFLGSLDA